MTEALLPLTNLEQRIVTIRGQRVMLDVDLAALYGVSTKRFNEQVKRNQERFPVDFMFQLLPEEKAEVVANCDRLEELEAHVAKHDNSIATLVAAIRQLTAPPTTPRRPIGFTTEADKKS